MAPGRRKEATSGGGVKDGDIPDDRLVQHLPMPCGRPSLNASLGQRRADAELAQRSAFSSVSYRYRNLVERFFNKLKNFQAVATRYDKTPENHVVSVSLHQ
jgi:transposase